MPMPGTASKSRARLTARPRPLACLTTHHTAHTQSGEEEERSQSVNERTHSHVRPASKPALLLVLPVCALMAMCVGVEVVGTYLRMACPMGCSEPTSTAAAMPRI